MAGSEHDPGQGQGRVQALNVHHGPAVASVQCHHKVHASGQSSARKRFESESEKRMLKKLHGGLPGERKDGAGRHELDSSVLNFIPVPHDGEALVDVEVASVELGRGRLTLHVPRHVVGVQREPGSHAGICENNQSLSRLFSLLRHSTLL